MDEVSISPAAMRIVKLLVGKPPQSIADLIDATGVTRTAVTEQLNELSGSGFIERCTERLTGRGRPRYLYAATDAALSALFAGYQGMLVPAIWRAIDEVGGEDLTGEVLEKVSAAMAAHYRSQITAKQPEGRLRQLGKILGNEGGLVEVVARNGKMVMKKRSCPFISMLDENRNVCCVDQQMMAAIVGSKVRRTSCRLEGSHCCTFEVRRSRRRKK